jgi:hypothetical protein
MLYLCTLFSDALISGPDDLCVTDVGETLLIDNGPAVVGRVGEYDNASEMAESDGGFDDALHL